MDLRLPLASAIAWGVVTGCASTPEVLTVPVPVEITVYETVPVPAALLRACKVPDLDLKTNQDLESALGAAILELIRCTQDKNAIRDLE